MEYRNYTPFPSIAFESHDEQHRRFGIAVVQGSFHIRDGQQLRIIDDQPPIRLQDEYYGDPLQTSLQKESCLIPFKTGADVLVNANAFSPNGRPASQWQVSIRFGTITHRLTVTGARSWERKFGGYSLSEIIPSEQVPLRYEYAFGGSYTQEDGESEIWPPNPVGRGFIPEKRAKLPDRLDAPQIFARPEDANGLTLGSPVAIAGIGPVPPHWQSRLKFAGTYNLMWRETAYPGYPSDFQWDFYRTAPSGLQLPGYANGDERVELINMTPNRRHSFALPGIRLSTLMRFHSGAIAPGPAFLDTIHLDLPEQKAHLTWRAIFPADGELRVLEMRSQE